MKRIPQDQLLSHIQGRVEVSDGCWLWRGSLHRGYGTMCCVLGRPVRVHRAVWFLTHGSWPKVIHHRCGNRHCCNPDHLVEMPSLGAHSRLHAGETCPRGHKPERFRIREDNSRYCRECDRLRKRAARHGPDGSRLRAKEAAAQKRRRSDG